MNTYTHDTVIERANKLAKRAARPYPQATRGAIISLRNEFLERLEERVAKRGNTFQDLTKKRIFQV
jgi:hypothetical protein